MRQAAQAYALQAVPHHVQALAKVIAMAAVTDVRAAEADALTVVTALVTRAVQAIAHATVA